MIECTQCGVAQPRSEFTPDRRKRSGLASSCKGCNRRRANDRYASLTPEKLAARAAKARAWREANPERVKRISTRSSLRAHGVDLEEFESMLIAQGGGCGVCGGTDERRLALDHDHTCCPGKHSCGKCIRGLLCRGCNVAIGSAGDSPERLRKLANYLEARDGNR